MTPAAELRNHSEQLGQRLNDPFLANYYLAIRPILPVVVDPGQGFDLTVSEGTRAIIYTQILGRSLRKIYEKYGKQSALEILLYDKRDSGSWLPIQKALEGRSNTKVLVCTEQITTGANIRQLVSFLRSAGVAPQITIALAQTINSNGARDLGSELGVNVVFPEIIVGELRTSRATNAAQLEEDIDTVVSDLFDNFSMSAS